MVLGGRQADQVSSPFCSECQLHPSLKGAIDPFCHHSLIAFCKVCITGLDRSVVFVFHTPECQGEARKKAGRGPR